MPEKYYDSFAQQRKYTYRGPPPFIAASNRPNRACENRNIPDFTSSHRKKLGTEWAPANRALPDPPLMIQPIAKYNKHVGQIPNYGGYIPGAIFRFGKTYGNDTRDAKRWLRGDFEC